MNKEKEELYSIICDILFLLDRFVRLIWIALTINSLTLYYKYNISILNNIPLIILVIYMTITSAIQLVKATIEFEKIKVTLTSDSYYYLIISLSMLIMFMIVLNITNIFLAIPYIVFSIYSILKYLFILGRDSIINSAKNEDID